MGCHTSFFKIYKRRKSDLKLVTKSFLISKSINICNSRAKWRLAPHIEYLINSDFRSIKYLKTLDQRLMILKLKNDNKINIILFYCVQAIPNYFDINKYI